MDGGKSSTGLDPNVAAGLAVALGWIGGLIFFLVEKDSAFVRFYAVQSMFNFVINIVLIAFSFTLGFLPGLGLMRSVLVGGATILPTILFIVMLISAFQGRVWEIPVLGKSARRIAGL